MKLLYFAWLRAKIGIAEETVEPPAGVATVGALLDWLKRRGPGFADALKDASVVRVAVNDAGNVTDTTLQYPGSSRYFAQKASESAKAWRFAPATARQSRKWLLQFEFTRSGVEANAVAMP